MTKTFFGIGILGLIILVGSGLWYWSLSFNTSGQEEAAEYICAFVQIYHEEPCQTSWLIENHMEELTICRRRLGVPEAQDGPKWLACVEERGVRVLPS